MMTRFERTVRTIKSTRDRMTESPLQLTFGQRQSAFLQSTDDFRKQRCKVTRRTHKLKKYLRIQSKNTRSYKHSTITKDNYIESHKYYLLSLLTVERDYLYALEIQSLLEINSANAKSKQRLIATRLKRGLQNANGLVEISGDEENFSKRAEILVYRELIQGHYAIQVKKWKLAIESYSIARVALQFLEGESSENSVLYKDIIEEIIDTAFKLAIYRDSKKSTIDLTEYSRKVVQTLITNELHSLISSKDTEFLQPTAPEQLVKEINYRSYVAQVKDETTAKLISRALSTQLSSLESFDNALQLWSEAQENHESFIARSIHDDEEQDDQILLAFIKYSSLLTRIRRDEGLLSKNKKESLRILDTIAATVKEILELPGVYSDDELALNIQTLGAFYHAQKQNIIASHFFSVKSYAKSLLVSASALKLLQDISFTIDLDFVNNDNIKSITQQLTSLKQNTHVLAQIEAGLSKDKSISDDINQFHSSFTIVNLELQPIPVKPVLFDLAYNYISYTKDGKQSYAEAPEMETSPEAEVDDGRKKKGGIFGLFGR